VYSGRSAGRSAVVNGVAEYIDSMRTSEILELKKEVAFSWEELTGIKE
jgi:hypothetical protein